MTNASRAMRATASVWAGEDVHQPSDSGRKREVGNATVLGIPSYVVRHLEGSPDEVEADSYVEQDGELVFNREGTEVMRIPLGDVVSVAPKGGS